MAEQEPNPDEALKTAEKLAAVEGSPATPEKASATSEPETAEKPEETPEKTEEVKEPENVPSDPKEAGRAFAQMRNRIKELEEAVETSKGKTAETVEPPFNRGYNFESPQTPLVGQPDQNQFYDPETGNFDVARFQTTVQ